MAKRKLLSRRPLRTPAPSKEYEEEEELTSESDASDVDDSEEGEASFLSYGKDAAKRVTDYQKHASRPRAREFFITKKEIEAANGNCTVRVHFVVDYSKKEWQVAAPFVTLKVGQHYDQFVCAGADCALVAGGKHEVVKPVYYVVDHRSYETKDGKKGSDDIKQWTPPAAVKGLIENAIAELAEDEELSIENIDLRNYEARITKSGTGRGSSWGVSFARKSRPMAKDIVDKIGKFFGCKGTPSLQEYRTHLGKLLQPDPKWMLSRNGNKPWHEGATLPEAASKVDTDDNVPY